MWRRIRADGCEWEVRAAAGQAPRAAPDAEDHDILEFLPIDAIRPARRVAVSSGSLPRMNDAELRAAFRRALPIGGDHYGRPGKTMDDVGQ